ncbi:MAG TPA: MaoC/PaaZ C-terminal domain-containing protein [Allosphingosinicella sp.]|nr:MaoC/PaaZ C-terminal domain-containing protein [Allosphingosinicella sp.]
MIQPDLVRAYRAEPVVQSYGAKDVILYALGVGARAGEEDLHYVYEKALVPLPTFAVVLARETFWLNEPRFGIDVSKLLHGEQRLEIHAPLPASGRVRGQLEVEALHDKGEGRGALLVMKRSISDAETGAPLATVRITSFLRANGGFGGDSAGAAVPHILPERAPDLSVAMPTSPEQALLYRLSGDYNPIHVDRDVAAKAGFPGPILHGLCTYGIACRAVLRGVCGDDPARLRRFDARFSSPVYPGDEIVTDIWREGDTISFRSRVPARDALVLNNGLALLA